MQFVRSFLTIGFLSLILVACNSSPPDAVVRDSNKPNPQSADSGGNLVYMDVKAGRIEIELLPDLAPNHVERIKTLVKDGFYDGIVFHRVINGFMAQTGDPTGTGRGGSKLPDLKAEFTPTPFVRGVLGMARSQNPNSANSQFFIMFAPGDFLNGKYTVFGKVVKGMEFVDAIKKGDQANNGSVSDPDKIIKMYMAK